MGKLSDIKKKQAELMLLAEDKVDTFARKKSTQINKRLSNSHYSKPAILMATLILMLVFFGLGVFLYKAEYYRMAPSEPVHQPILAPAAQEVMEEKLLQKIKEKARGKVTYPAVPNDSSETN